MWYDNVSSWTLGLKASGMEPKSLGTRAARPEANDVYHVDLRHSGQRGLIDPGTSQTPLL